MPGAWSARDVARLRSLRWESRRSARGARGPEGAPYAGLLALKGEKDIGEVMNEMSSLAMERLVFIDETGARLEVTRTHGRSVRGQPVPDRVPRNRGDNVRVIAGMSSGGVDAVTSVNGGASAEVLLAFIDRVLASVLRPGDIFVLDNLGADGSGAVHRAFQRWQ